MDDIRSKLADDLSKAERGNDRNRIWLIREALEVVNRLEMRGVPIPSHQRVIRMAEQSLGRPKSHVIKAAKRWRIGENLSVVAMLLAPTVVVGVGIWQMCERSLWFGFMIFPGSVIVAGLFLIMSFVCTRMHDRAVTMIDAY